MSLATFGGACSVQHANLDMTGIERRGVEVLFREHSMLRPKQLDLLLFLLSLLLQFPYQRKTAPQPRSLAAATRHLAALSFLSLVQTASQVLFGAA